MRVLLIDMPFGEVRLPSLALGLLKAELQGRGTGCDVANLKLLFASMIGWDNYVWLSGLTALLSAGAVVEVKMPFSIHGE